MLLNSAFERSLPLIIISVMLLALLFAMCAVQVINWIKMRRKGYVWSFGDYFFFGNDMGVFLIILMILTGGFVTATGIVYYCI